MPTELTILAYGALLLLVHIFAAANAKTRQYGVAWNTGARDEQLPPLEPVPGRLTRAQANFLETLPIAVIALLGVVVAWWGIAFRGVDHPAVLAAAACVLATHLCLTIASYGPPSLPVSRPLVLLWVRRGVLVYLPVPLLYLLALAIRGEPAPPGMWVIGMLAVGAASVIAMLMAPQEVE